MSTWRKKAGRTKGSDGYEFGDFSRSLLNAVGLAGDHESKVVKLEKKMEAAERAIQADSQAKERICSNSNTNNNKSTPVAIATLEMTTQSNDYETSDISADETNGGGAFLRDACWPDPDPVVASNDSSSSDCGGGGKYPMVDDVTRMNATPVSRVIFVRSADDIKMALRSAQQAGKKVSMRGTKHTMGGQTIPPDMGYVLDMARFNQILEIDRKSMTVRVQPGAQWTDLLIALNRYGLSPRTMQSYCSFSIGGAVAVNAHGITTDYCMHESVVRFTLIRWNGTEIVCEQGGDGTSGELFGLAIGGYGMFGVFSELTLRVVPNTHLSLDVVNVPVSDFPRIYGNLVQNGGNNVEIKLARLDLTTMKNATMFVFRKSGVSQTVSRLGLQPREMSQQNQILYKWLLPSAAKLRVAFERQMGRAVDWADENERNLLMYESALPLAKMYSPLYQMDDTFVLQEYFVPANSFASWVAQAEPVVKCINDEPGINLLNITVRFVKYDDVTHLAYSRAKSGSYAFVLYFRMHRTSECDKKLAKIHHVLGRFTLKLGGVFYLPYRHHYSDKQLLQAYPQMPSFVAAKQKYDPHELFDSLWYRRYGKPLQEKRGKFDSGGVDPYMVLGKQDIMLLNRSNNSRKTPEFAIPLVSERRDNSYRRLMNDPLMNEQFFEAFLTKIFNVEDPHQLKCLIAKAVFDPDNAVDLDIFEALRTDLAAGGGGGLAAARKVWKSIKQLRAQKQELTRETGVVLQRLQRLGNIHDYVCIGDNGKTVLPFRSAFGMRGRSWVVHNANNLGEIDAILERGSTSSVGQFIPIDYGHPDRPLELENECADLVTMNQGLHHLPQTSVMGFLKELWRILRPGGILIIREHDARPELIPMLDLAHSVFNAVTGVSKRDERHEIRAFRSVLEWRRIVATAGFTDTMLYEMEDGDPTLDEMMVFIKGSADQIGQPIKNEQRKIAASGGGNGRSGGNGGSGIPLVDQLLSEAPTLLLEMGRTAVDGLMEKLQKLQITIGKALIDLPAGRRFIVSQMLDGMVAPVIDLLKQFRPYLDDVKIKDLPGELIPKEFFLLIEALRAKAERGEASPNELIAVSLIMEITEMISGKDGDGVGEDGMDVNGSIVEEIPTEVDQSMVYALFQRLFAVRPELSQPGCLERAGFGHRAEMAIKSRMGGSMDAEKLAGLVTPYLDNRAYDEMATALDVIISGNGGGNGEYPFSFDSVQDGVSPWSLAMMGFLGSPRVRPNQMTLSMASWAGFGGIVRMWEEAQRVRGAAAYEAEMNAANGDPIDTARVASLSANQRRALKIAVKLVGTDDSTAAMESLERALRLSGLIKQQPRDGISWYKLPEWLQVEIVQIFGNYMQIEPWYRFPFMSLLNKYFSILFKEFQVVYSKYGLSAAAFSTGFLVDAVPGIVMALLFGQMQLLAYPVRMALGDEYSEELLRTQTETLVVSLPRRLGDDIEWVEIDERIRNTVVVDGLQILKVPSMLAFTDVLIKIALALEDEPSVRLVRVSNHSELQVRISVDGEDHEEFLGRLRSLRGANVKFTFKLPTDGDPRVIPKHNYSLSVKATSLLEVLRFCIKSDVKTIQVYDTWV